MSERTTALTASASARAAISVPVGGGTENQPSRSGASWRTGRLSARAEGDLEPVALAGLVPADSGRVPIIGSVEGRTVKGDLNPKSVKKAVATVAEHGPAAVAVVLQGAKPQ